MTPRAAVLLLVAVVLGFVAASCGESRSSHDQTTDLASGLQTTDLPYTVARIKPSIAAARASNRSLFSIFPSIVSARACRIPRGGPVSKVMTLPGTCATSLTYAKSGNAVASFTERWHEPSNTQHSWQHTWRMIVSTDGRVVETRSLGTPPPQFWR